MGVKVTFDCDRCGATVKRDFSGYADLDYAIEEISHIKRVIDQNNLLMCDECHKERKDVRKRVMNYKADEFKKFYKGVKKEFSDPAIVPHEFIGPAIGHHE